MKVLLIIPAYNEELNLEKVIEDIITHTAYDYIIIDDCSTDRTMELCEKMGYPYLHLPINYGLTSAVQLGYKYAVNHGYDVAIQFDGDGQHKAEYLKPLVEAVESGADIAIASRFVTQKKPWNARMLGSRLLSFLIRLTTGKKVSDPTSGMRAFSKDTFKEYAINMNYTPEPDTLVYMLKKGKRIEEIQVSMDEREFGESYLNPIKSIKYMMEMVISILLIQTFRKR